MELQRNPWPAPVMSRNPASWFGDDADRQRRTFPGRVRVTVIVVSVLMAFMGLAFAAVAIDLLSWRSTDGVVVEDLGRGRALVRFTDERERTWEVAADWDEPVDRVVTVRYDPQEPSELSLDRLWPELIFVLVMSGLYVGGGVALIVVVLPHRRRSGSGGVRRSIGQ